MKLNTVVKLPDGRIGTICHHFLDGNGGVWGKHKFEMAHGGFGGDIPERQFMLREKEVEHLLGYECVGEEFEIIYEPD